MSGRAERVRRFLRTGPAEVLEASTPSDVLLDAGERGMIAAPKALLEEMVGAGLIVREGSRVKLAAPPDADDRTPEGDPIGAAPRLLEAWTPGGNEDGPALLNLAESPLGLLMRRKAKDGSPFLAAAEFQAGERLRADYTRGLLMPRLGANWVATVASGRRHGGSGIADLTDAALAARLRVEQAIAAVGPELAGVLVDICCFLKGLEQVESERGWPVRSAKIVLKSALSALARHYHPAERPRAARNRMLHWGAGDFRPVIK